MNWIETNAEKALLNDNDYQNENECTLYDDRWPKSVLQNPKSKEQATQIANFKMNKFRFHQKEQSTNPVLLPATTIVGSI